MILVISRNACCDSIAQVWHEIFQNGVLRRYVCVNVSTKAKRKKAQSGKSLKIGKIPKNRESPKRDRKGQIGMAKPNLEDSNLLNLWSLDSSFFNASKQGTPLLQML